MTIYLLDTNVFIQAKNLHYGLDFCPAFWEWLVTKNKDGRLFTIDRVVDEIKTGVDELTTWIEQQDEQFWLKTDGKMTPQLGTVSQWVMTQVMQQTYEAAATNIFFRQPIII